MSHFDKILRVTTPLAALAVGASSIVALFTQPISLWTTVSLIAFLAVLSASIAVIFFKPHNIFGLVAALFSGLTIGRLFSTMRLEAPGSAALSSLDPLLVAETGPGLNTVTYASVLLFALLVLQLLRFAWRQSHGEHPDGFIGQPSANDWGLTFIRLYVGLMFIAHFSGHLFGGPVPFGVFSEYFGSIGLPFPSAFVVLAGLIEIAVAFGLAFGFMTRIAAISATIYLFVSVGLGGHYGVGYVWVLPTGGWEFPALWMFGTAMFGLTGGGNISLDHAIKTKFSTLTGPVKLALA